MSYLEALVLALVQALTEFLPVSSSGHLVLAQRCFNSGAEIDLLYDVMLHLATTVAVLVYFRDDVRALVASAVGRRTTGASAFSGHEHRTLVYIVLATLPTAVLGWIIQRYFVAELTRVDVVGGMLMVTGLVLWFGRRAGANRPVGAMTPLDALAVGLCQGAAVVPGVSRSGVTITGGIALGLAPELAARFSLLISVPAILGASVLQVYSATPAETAVLGPYALGMAVAALVGYLAIDLIMRLVRRGRFHLFALYLWPLGLLAVVWHHLG